MIVSQRIATFTEKYPLVGPVMWILSVEYFIVQIIAAMSWRNAYSITQNTISDLGNTACGMYGARYICSPLHGLMNGSFILLGIFMMMGSVLIYQEFKETNWSVVGFDLMFLAGFGTLLVGLFPENTVSSLHVLGAFLALFIGNVAIIVLGTVLELPAWLRFYSIASGVIALTALGLFYFHAYAGIGVGGTERIAGYPVTVWLIVFGLYISKNHYLGTANNSVQ